MRTTLLFAFALLAACRAPYGMGRFDSDGWSHDTFPLRLRAERDGSLVGSDWRISSHTPEGRVRRDNLHTRRLDRDDDGRMDLHYRALANEVELEHRTDGASLWVRTFIVPTELEDAPIERVAGVFVEALSGTDRVVWNAGSWRVGWATERYEATSLDEATAAVHGHAAHVSLIEVRRTDSAGASGAAHVALTFVRVPFRWREEKRDGSFREWPVMLVAGYAGNESTFGRHWDDYTRMIEALEIGDAGTSGSSTPNARTGEPPRDAGADDEAATADDSAGAHDEAATPDDTAVDEAAPAADDAAPEGEPTPAEAPSEPEVAS